MIVDETYKLYENTTKRDNTAWNSVHTILYGISDSSSDSSNDNCNVSEYERGGEMT